MRYTVFIEQEHNMTEIVTCFEGFTVTEVIDDDLAYFLSDEVIGLDTSEGE